MLTPKFAAIWTVLLVVARCSRSVNAVFEDCASAFCTFVSARLSPFGPTGLPMGSPPSFSTLMACGSLQPVFWPGSSYTPTGIASEYDIGSESLVTQMYVLEFRMLFWTSMPCDTAVDSTYGLNDDPTCSRVRVVFWWQSETVHCLTGSFSPRPGYRARIAPVFGSCSSAPISAQDGKPIFGLPQSSSICGILSMFSSTALYISSSIGRLTVVMTFMPPLSISFDGTWSTSCSSPQTSVIRYDAQGWVEVVEHPVARPGG